MWLLDGRAARDTVAGRCQLYAAWRLQSEPEGGATILNKVLYYAEFGHMRQFGQPITGARYFRLPDGPAPRALLPTRNELIESGAAEINNTTFNGRLQDRLVPREEPVIEHLDADEIKSIDEAHTLMRGKTARQASEMSHEELGWRFVGNKELIPLETAFLSPVTMVTDRVMRRATEPSFTICTRPTPITNRR